ncbi:MAG TPA: ABC transporter substrate-binding protein [Actinomycetota bacterium]|nr:ABC transporter substrate-binding protein [Actinomycetota bacterium]
MGGDLSRRELLKRTGIAGAALLAGTACKDLASGFTKTSIAGPNDIILSKGPDTTGTLEKVLAMFNKENQSFKVVLEIASADTGQYFDEMRTQFQVGGGEIDVIGADVIWPAQLAANGWIEDLSDLFTEEMQQDYLESTIETSTYKGKIYGVPWYSDAGLLYYRKDLLDKAGLKPPKTWDELLSQARKVQEQEGIPYGFVFQGAEYEGGVCNQCEYIWNAGGDILAPDDPSKVLIGSPEATAGYESAVKNISSGVAPVAVVTYKETESLTVFIAGEAVFLRNWPYAYSVATGGEAAGSVLKPEWVGVAHLPVVNEGDQGYATLGGWDFCINSFSDKKEQSWEFIQWMSQPKIQKMFAIDAGYIPGRKSLFEDEQLLKEQPVMELGRSSFESTKPRPSANPFYSDMSLDMAQAFTGTLKGDIQPQQAISTLNNKLERIADVAEQIFNLGG